MWRPGGTGSVTEVNPLGKEPLWGNWELWEWGRHESGRLGKGNLRRHRVPGTIGQSFNYLRVNLCPGRKWGVLF